MPSFSPKPPPTSDATTLIPPSSIRSDSASCLRTRCGTCVEMHTVSSPPRHSASTALVSIGSPVTRLTKKRPSTTTSASRMRASASPEPCGLLTSRLDSSTPG